MIHAFYAAAGAAVGAIAGYLTGVILYIVLLSSSAFATANSATTQAVQTAAVNGGTLPLIFAITLAALGFFMGYYESANNEKTQ